MYKYEDGKIVETEGSVQGLAVCQWVGGKLIPVGGQGGGGDGGEALAKAEAAAKAATEAVAVAAAARETAEAAQAQVGMTAEEFSAKIESMVTEKLPAVLEVEIARPDSPLSGALAGGVLDGPEAAAKVAGMVKDQLDDPESELARAIAGAGGSCECPSEEELTAKIGAVVEEKSGEAISAQIKDPESELARAIAGAAGGGGIDIATPEVLAPEGATLLLDNAFTAVCSGFASSFAPDSHASTDWILTDESGALLKSDLASSDLTSHEFTDVKVQSGSALGVMARHNGALGGRSAWSAKKSFSTTVRLTAPGGRLYGIDGTILTCLYTAGGVKKAFRFDLAWTYYGKQKYPEDRGYQFTTDTTALDLPRLALTEEQKNVYLLGGYFYPPNENNPIDETRMSDAALDTLFAGKDIGYSGAEATAKLLAAAPDFELALEAREFLIDDKPCHLPTIEQWARLMCDNIFLSWIWREMGHTDQEHNICEYMTCYAFCALSQRSRLWGSYNSISDDISTGVYLLPVLEIEPPADFA